MFLYVGEQMKFREKISGINPGETGNLLGGGGNGGGRHDKRLRNLKKVVPGLGKGGHNG
jgi:hypothetical protein